MHIYWKFLFIYGTFSNGFHFLLCRFCLCGQIEHCVLYDIHVPRKQMKGTLHPFKIFSAVFIT